MIFFCYPQLQYEIAVNRKEFEALKMLNSELHHQIKEKLKSSSAKSTENLTVLPEKTEPPTKSLTSEPPKALSQAQKLKSQPTSKASTSEQQKSANPAKFVIYDQCLQISQKDQAMLEQIPTSADNDRKFINSLFDVIFQDGLLATMFSNENNDRKKLKDKLATLVQYSAMKGIKP